MEAVNSAEKNELVGNHTLVSNEEECVARILRERNLHNTNSTSKPVRPRDTFYTRYGKRLLDILISLPACIIFLPLNFVLGICTFFDVGRPILFRQTRVGRYGKRFTMVKFRNMNEKKDNDGKLLPPSQRVTRFGYFMRKFSLDELLSFWNVLKGDMSIIGPRPMPVFIHERMSDRHRQRTLVRPGLECPRVIHVENEDIFKFHRTYENDIWYVENISLALDIKLLWKLVKMTFSMGKRKDQAKGNNISYFVGYDEQGRAISMINYRQLYAKQANGVERSIQN